MIATRLAWRNVWRNRRRTMITMASVFFAVVLTTLVISFKEGVYSNLIDSTIGAYMGFGQVHAKDYWEERVLEYSFEADPALIRQIESHLGVTGTLPRLESFALAATDDITRVAMVVGVDPEKETQYNHLHHRVSAGEYITADDQSAMVGDGLATSLDLSVGDTLILLGQGYRGVSATGKYPVKAIVKFGSPELSKQLVFLPIREAQWLYGMEGRLNNLILHFENPDNAPAILDAIQSGLGDEYEVMGWPQLVPDLKNMIETDRVEGYVIMFILYLVVSFGIFGTILMMLAERKREMGMLVAIGMKRMRLAFTVWTETVLVSVMGAVLGMIGAFPICYYFLLHPISLGNELKKMTEEYGIEAVIQTSIEPFIFLQQGLVVFLIACLISLYPLITVARLNAVKALRG